MKNLMKTLSFPRPVYILDKFDNRNYTESNSLLKYTENMQIRDRQFIQVYKPTGQTPDPETEGTF